VAADGKVFAVEPYTKLVAVDPAAPAEGGAPGRVLWSAAGSIPDIAARLPTGSWYDLDTGGNLDCYDIRDGSKVYAQDLDAMFKPRLRWRRYAVSAGQQGEMILLKAGRAFEKLGENELGEERMPRLPCARRIYLRGIRNLYCIETKP